MRRILILSLLMVITFALQGADTIRVKQTRTPVLIDRKDNVLFYIRIDAQVSRKLNKLALKF